MLETNLALLDMVWDAAYRFDSVFWYDDMDLQGAPVLVAPHGPAGAKAVPPARHRLGARYGHQGTCGDINPLVPEPISMGLDALNPLEVKAGMDPIALKREYGKDLVLHGGINAVLRDQQDQIRAEMERLVPALKESGGYIFSSDHSVPSSVSLAGFREIVELAKRLGSY